MRATSCALAISGVDPSGGAGVYADLRGFATAGVWGCGAVAVITAQSTVSLRSAHPVPTAQLMAQIREIEAHQELRSVKVGALGSVANVRAVTSWLARRAAHLPVVVDPVMSATHARRGAHLLDPAGLRAMLRLVAVATVVTPNTLEAEALLGVTIATLEDVEHAALALVQLGARAALVKGGHLPARSAGAPRGQVVDVLAIGGRTLRLRAPRRPGQVHGTGCMLASLVAGKLAAERARGDDATIIAAVRWARAALARSRATARKIGDGQRVLA